MKVVIEKMEKDGVIVPTPIYEHMDLGMSSIGMYGQKVIEHTIIAKDENGRQMKLSTIDILPLGFEVGRSIVLQEKRWWNLFYLGVVLEEIETGKKYRTV